MTTRDINVAGKTFSYMGSGFNIHSGFIAINCKNGISCYPTGRQPQFSAKQQIEDCQCERMDYISAYSHFTNPEVYPSQPNFCEACDSDANKKRCQLEFDGLST